MKAEGARFSDICLWTCTHTLEQMAAHRHKQVPQSTVVRGCEHTISNEKIIDLRTYSAEILASPSLLVKSIIAIGPHGQILLALISSDFTYPVIIHY